MSNKCKIIYNNQGERVGVQEIGSNNPSQTFKDILNDPHTKNFDEALQIYKNLYSEDIEFITERVADKLPLTLPVFDLKQFAEMKGKMVNPISVQQMLNGGGIKQIEKDLINQVIEDNYKGQKRISYDELEATVRANIMPLERITTSSYADYGMDNLGSGNYGEAKTLILNAPIEHGVTGHFSGDFKASGRQNIKYVPKQLNDNVWVAVEEGYESQANDNNIYQYVGTAGTKEAVDEWINNYENETKFANSNYIVYEDIFYKTKDYNNNVNPIEGFQTKEDVEQFIKENNSKYDGNLDYLPQSDYSSTLKGGSINKGMFGHIRVWQDGQDYYVAELQSDYFQKNNARKEILEKNKDYKEAETVKSKEEDILKDKRNETFIKLKDLGYRFVTGRKGASTQTEVYIPKNQYGLPLGDRTGVKLVEKDGYYTIDNNGINPNGNYYADRQLAETNLERLANEESRDLDEVTYLSKSELPLELHADFDFLTKNYYQEQKNIEKSFNQKVEKIIQNLPKDQKQFIASQKIWEQRMVREAIKEASLSGATSLRFPTPYTLSVIEGYLSEGAPYEIENANDSTYLEAGDRIYYAGEDYTVVDSDSTTITIAESGRVSSSLDEDIISQEVDNAVDNDMYEIENNLRDFYIQEEWNDFRDNYSPISSTELDEVGNEIEEGVFEVSEGKIRDIVSEYYNNIFTDAESIIKDIYGNDVWVNGNTVTWTDGTANIETLMQPSEYKGQGTKDSFSIEDDLDDTQQTVARKYEEISEILKKEKPVEIVTDENGFDWYEAPITQEDTQSPVVAFSLSQADPTLKYQTEEGNIYTSYAEALRNTNGNEIKIGANTVGGFKEIYSKSTNTNVDSQDGLINHLIKTGILSDKTYSFNGKTHLIPEGRTSAKKTINAEIIKDTFQQKLGVKTAKLQADGSVLIDEDNSRNKVRITNKSGDLVTVDLNTPFSELKKEFEPETIAQIFAGNTLNKAMSGKTITKQEFVPEDKLQEMLMNLLKKFGIKTLSFEDYLKNYQIRNGLPINARALADTANKLIAFKDGIIENDDLVEEVAHLIESSIPQEQKENILRNIHKTKEWGQFYEQYKNLYPTENELRREILGKVIANSIKEQFQARNQNITEDSIINKIKQFFDEFLARIRAYFQDSFQTELDNLTKEIYKNLEEETLTLDLEGVNNIFFSDTNSSVSIDKIVERTQKAIEIVKDQERLLSKKYKNPANKSAIQSIEKSFEFAEKVYKTNGVAQFAKLISSQVNTLLDSANKKEKGKYPLNAEENVVYVNLVKKIKPALSEIEFLLDKKDSQEMAIKEELEKIADSLRQLEAKVVAGREDAILDLAKKAVATHDMTDKERQEYETLVRMALSGSQKDTDIIHAHLGSLLMAKNPLLNLAGNTIERMTLLQNEDFQKNWKNLTSKLESLNWKQKDFEAIIDENTFEIINEIDSKKVAENDKKEKEDIKNRVLEQLKSQNLIGDFEIEGEPNFEELQTKYPDRQDELNYFESAYKKEWNKNLSERRESFFKKEFIKEKENHPIKINGAEPTISSLALEVEAQFRKERATIRINAGDVLSPSDQARIKEVDKQQREAENPRNSVTGELYKGIEEVYDENLERWVVVINENEFKDLSTEDKERVSTIVGLNHLRYKNQDFYKKRKGDAKEIPQTFLDRLSELQTTEEKLAFIDNNAFISFPDEYYNQFKDQLGLVDRLREAGQDSLIRSIRTQQAIINNIMKQMAVHNRPSETNYVEMHKTQKDAIIVAQSSLDALYTEARGVLTDEVVDRELNMDNLTNEAYEKYLEDSGMDEFQFILENVTLSNATLIQTAKHTAMSGGVNKMFTRDMDDAERQQVLMDYAKSKLLPYLKRTEPVGYTEHYKRMINGEISVEEWMQRTDLVKVSPSFNFYEQSEDLNPVWQKNKEQGKEQWTQEYIDKVKDSRYDEIIKNDRLRQGREAILEYQDAMIENNNLTGVQSRYMIPGVRRTTTQRLTSLTASGIKETFMEGLQFRPEEQEVGARIQDSLYTVPVYYNKPLEDKAEQTKDYLYAYAVYGQAASQHKARRETISDMFVIEDALTSTNSQSKNTLKMFKSFMEYNYYGKKEAFSYEMDFLGRKVDVGKILRTLNNYAKKTNLSGLVVPITSFAQSTVQKNMERIIGETIDPVSSNEGNAMFFKYAGSSARESMSFKSKSIPNVIGEALGLYSIVHRLENSQLNKAGRLAVNLSSKLHELGNFPVVQRAMFGTIASYRYVDGKIMHYSRFKQKMISQGFKGNIQSEWKKQDSFLEDFVLAVENGVLDFNNPKFAEKIKTRNLVLPEGMSLEEYLESKKQDISTRTLAFINRIDSQIPKQQKSIGERDARATFFLSHMGWLLSAIPRKIKERHYNYSEQTFQEGSWRTAVNFLNDILKTPKKMREVYGELDENQQKNLKRVMVELGYANALVLVALLLSNMNDDDDDPMYALAMADLFANRVAVEQIGGTVGIPSSVFGLTEEPIMLKRKIEDWVKVTNLAGESEEQFKYLKGVLPFLRDIEKFADPIRARQTYLYFNQERKGLYSKYAWISHAIEE